MMTLALISGGALIRGLAFLLIIGVVLWLVNLLIEKSPVQEPFRAVLKWIVYAAGVFVLIDFLLSLVGRSFIRW